MKKRTKGKVKSVIISEGTHNRLKRYCDNENLYVGAFVEGLINNEVYQNELHSNETRKKIFDRLTDFISIQQNNPDINIIEMEEYQKVLLEQENFLKDFESKF